MKLCTLLLLLAVLLPACSRKYGETAQPYNSNCLWHLQVGRDYAGQGRLELAREHMLMAMGSNNDPGLRQLLSWELKSLETMIESKR